MACADLVTMRIRPRSRHRSQDMGRYFDIIHGAGHEPSDYIPTGIMGSEIFFPSLSPRSSHRTDPKCQCGADGDGIPRMSRAADEWIFYLSMT